MFIVTNYTLAVVLCFITMLCWGSWANTQKLAGKSWRYELFYWDYVIGILLFSVILGLTLGSTGDTGRSFITDLKQVTPGNYASALIGGAVFNLGNILLSAAVSMAGMTVAFPLGVGIALVLGVIINYIGAPKGDPTLLFLGVILVVIAIVLNAMASGKMHSSSNSGSNKKGIIIAIIAGVLMSFFYRFVAAAMDLNNFESPTPGMATPYSAFFHLFGRHIPEQPTVQHYCYAPPLRGKACQLLHLFQRAYEPAPSRYPRRRHLGVGYST